MKLGLRLGSKCFDNILVKAAIPVTLLSFYFKIDIFIFTDGLIASLRIKCNKHGEFLLPEAFIVDVNFA